MVNCLLDFSAAFDTVDHATFSRRLELTFGVTGPALAWLQDYLADRTQSVSWDGSVSVSHRVLSGVPQGSALGPLLFMLYVADVGWIIESFSLSWHAYADDEQVYSSCLPLESDHLLKCLKDCIREIACWAAVNRLALNPKKTELIWFSTRGGNL